MGVRDHNSNSNDNPISCLLKGSQSHRSTHLSHNSPRRVIRLVSDARFTRGCASNILSFTRHSLRRRRGRGVVSDFRQALLPKLSGSRCSVL